MLIFILVSILSGILAGMGIGGGSIFILLCNLFNLLDMNNAKVYNLIMFITAGIFATIFNLKNNNIEKDKLKKIIVPTIFGSIIGIFTIKKINQNLVKNFFYLFMLILGIYEIFSSLINIKKSNNIYKQ